jgi:hypothetical protein
MNVEQALCVRQFLKDVGYRNSMQRAALQEAIRVIEEAAVSALLDFQFQAPDTGHSEGQSIATESEPGSAAAPPIRAGGASKTAPAEDGNE